MTSMLSARTAFSAFHRHSSFAYLQKHRCNARYLHMDSAPPSATRASASTTSFHAKKRLQYGRTHVIPPKGEHRATVVWLHGLGDVGASWAEVLETLPLRNIKWIVPTAPVQSVAVFGGFPCNAWFDVGSLNETEPNDLDGMDSAAAHIAGLLSEESPGIKLGIGGFSQGAATTLYTTICSIAGKHSDGSVFPCKFSVVVGLSGWLPAAEDVKNRLDGNVEALERARELPVFLGHGTGDDIVLYKYGEKSAATLQSLGFSKLNFKTYKGLTHTASDQVLDDVSNFLKEKLQLES